MDQMSDCADFKENRLVSALVEDVANPPKLLYGEGLIGQSSRRDYIRFYTNRTLEEYYDLPCPSVRHVARLPRGKRPFRADAIWVDPKKLGNSPAIYRQGDSQTPLDAGALAKTFGAALQPAEGAQQLSEGKETTITPQSVFPSPGDRRGGGGRGSGTAGKYKPP